MGIERFEDLKSWQKSRLLANRVYVFTTRPEFRRDSSLRDQIQGAAGSIMHSIAEGFDAGSGVDFVRLLQQARRFASEVQSQLYLAADRHYINDVELHGAYNLAAEVKCLIDGLITRLRGCTSGQESVSSSPSCGCLTHDTAVEDCSLDEPFSGDCLTEAYETNDYLAHEYEI